MGDVLLPAFHPEPIDPGRLEPPFAFPPDTPDGAFANMGMGVALVREHAGHLKDRLAELGGTLEEVRYRDFLAYPLTGGYGSRQLAPEWIIRTLLGMEKRLPQGFYRLAGLRMLIVVRKVPDPPPE